MSFEILIIPYFLSPPHLSQLTCECTWTTLPYPILHDPQNRMLSNIINGWMTMLEKSFTSYAISKVAVLSQIPVQCSYWLWLLCTGPIFLHPRIQGAVCYETWTLFLFVWDPTVAGSTVLWNVGNTVHCHIVQRVKNRISTKHKSQWKFFV